VQKSPLAQVKEALARHENFYITTHVGPDADAIGSALALKRGLEKLGKSVVYVSRDGVPSSNKFLPHIDEVQNEIPYAYTFTCAIVMDCDGSAGRVASDYGPIDKARERILIDHHRGSQPIFEVNWLDPNKPATALMVYELLLAMEVEIDAEMAQNLLAGLSCDTGHFRFTNTTPESLAAAADLVAKGANANEVAYRIFDERSLASTKLLGTAIGKMQLEHDGKLIWTSLSQADFLAVGTGDESIENVVNVMRNISGAEMSIVFRERRDDEGVHARISVRADERHRADLFAKEFGGGGHAAAAGLRIRGDLNTTINKVIGRAKAWLDEKHPQILS
jgi:phosphoesterase RecJ-like protein